MSRKCELVVDHLCNDEGDLGDEIECAKPAAELVDGVAMCAECIAHILERDPDIITLAKREAIAQDGAADVR
jgi:hypothetical protein